VTIGLTLSLDTSIRVASEQVSCNLENEAFILDLKNGVYYSFNPVAARVWELAQEPRTVREIRDALLAEFDVESEECTRDLLRLVEQLHQWDLVEWRNGKGHPPL
jgi:hypothetical protein